VGGFGISLGSFSMSADFVQALLEEFKTEISEKCRSLDADPHFWMPLTLDLETYLMIQKSKDPKANILSLNEHYDRMNLFKKRFYEKKVNRRPLFGVVDIGNSSYWWDYGQLKKYFENNIKLTNQFDHESRIMRSFFGVPKISSGESSIVKDDPHRSSIVYGCEIQRGRIANSILIGVKADFINVSNSIIMNSTVGSIQGHGVILYNVRELQEVEFPENTNVRADVFHNSNTSPIKLHSHIDRQGNQDWEVRLGFNSHSFSEIYTLNKTTLLNDSFGLQNQDSPKTLRQSLL